MRYSYQKLFGLFTPYDCLLLNFSFGTFLQVDKTFSSDKFLCLTIGSFKQVACRSWKAVCLPELEGCVPARAMNGFVELLWKEFPYVTILGILALSGSVVFFCCCLCARLCCGAWPGFKTEDSFDDRNMDSESLDAEDNHKLGTNSDDSSNASSSGHTSLVISTPVTSPISLNTQLPSTHSNPSTSSTHSSLCATSTNHNTTFSAAFSATIYDPTSITPTFAPSTTSLPPSLLARPLTDVLGPWIGFPHLPPSYTEAMAHN